MPVTHYIWDPETDALLMEQDENGNTTVVYTHEPKPYGGLISQRRGGETYYHHFDGLGNTQQLMNASGQVTDEYVYTAFGETVAQSGTTENPFRWLGAVGFYVDLNAGRYYVRARFYDPALGRWQSADPLKFVDGSNLYIAAFIPNQSDPSGESTCFACTQTPPSGSRPVASRKILASTPLDPVIAEIIREAERRRGSGICADSGQHCWAACVFAAYMGGSPLAACFADFGEWLEPSDDWLCDVIANHQGHSCAVVIGPVGALVAYSACDLCCLTSPRGE